MLIFANLHTKNLFNRKYSKKLKKTIKNRAQDIVLRSISYHKFHFCVILLSRLNVGYFGYIKKCQTSSFLMVKVRHLALFPNKTDITNINFTKSARAFLP